MEDEYQMSRTALENGIDAGHPWFICMGLNIFNPVVVNRRIANAFKN